MTTWDREQYLRFGEERLRPVLDELAGPERNALLDDYRKRVRRAYPLREDGKAVLPFERLFLVAVAR